MLSDVIHDPSIQSWIQSFQLIYLLVNVYKKLLNMAIEIVDLPSYKMVDFSIAILT